MESQLINLLASLVGGGVGGNVAGVLLRKCSLGVVGNTITGVIGGTVGSQLIAPLLGGGGMLGLSSTIASSGTAGAALMILTGMIKQAVAR